MTLELFHALQETQGCELLARLAQDRLTLDDTLPVLERYRREYPVELVRAALDLTLLRHRARAKFSRADAMFFTRSGLEMASAEAVARHTAARFAGLPCVADCCCGIGGDLLALAQVAGEVFAVDADPLALEMARANAGVYGVEARVRFTCADVTTQTGALAAASAVFIDPCRRSDSAQRVSRRPEDYSPPLSWCLSLTQYVPRVAVKVAPALDYEQVLKETSAEVELISLDGECKEAIFWLGEFRTCTRRATLLPGGVTFTDDGPSSDALGEVGCWIYEPDAALIRAHLVQRLAGEYALHRIDPEIAYLSGDAEITSPAMTRYRVREVVPWGLKRVNAALASRGIGHVVIKKRGFPLTPEQLRPKLKPTGAAHATLICTRVHGQPVVIIAD